MPNVPSLMSLAFFEMKRADVLFDDEVVPAEVREECVRRNISDIDALVHHAYGSNPQCYHGDCAVPTRCARAVILGMLLAQAEVDPDGSVDCNCKGQDDSM